MQQVPVGVLRNGKTMPAHKLPPLRKVTINLFEEDCKTMELVHGHGWSEKVRLLVTEYIAKQRGQIQPLRPRKTVGDLLNE